MLDKKKTYIFKDLEEIQKHLKNRIAIFQNLVL